MRPPVITFIGPVLLKLVPWRTVFLGTLVLGLAVWAGVDLLSLMGVDTSQTLFDYLNPF